LRIASLIALLNAMSEASEIAVASAWPSASLGRADASSSTPTLTSLSRRASDAAVEHLEPRRHIGLERKLMQQTRAERVDGLHLESARGFEREREQLPRPCAHLRAGGDARRSQDDAVERGVVVRGPLRQRVEHPLRHVGGCRLGEGDAEDALGLGAFEQEPDHALRQHVGLA